MLKPEEANERLAQWRVPAEPNRIAEDADRLPAKLCEVAKHAYGAVEIDRAQILAGGGWLEVHARGREAVLQLDAMPVKERAKVFSVLSPHLAGAMEGAFQLLKTTPYQAGYQRNAFRALGPPEFHVERLYGWMTGMGRLGRLFPAELLTPAWLAAWTPHIHDSYHTFAEEVGTLLADVLNQRDAAAAEVFDVLTQSLNGQHEIGAPGRHVFIAFLLCNREEAWETVEKTLIAAQRQEGLRQSILEAIDLNHPEAFRRMLRLILDQDLVRFSAVIRAVDVWFGQLWTAASAGVVKKLLAQVVGFFEDPAARAKAIGGKDAEAAFLALWCAATEDAIASIPLAEKLLVAKSVELRYVAARHLASLQLDAAIAALVPALDDEDLRVAVVAVSGCILPMAQGITTSVEDDRFERLERLVDRVPVKPTTLKPLVWPWHTLTVKQQHFASCLAQALGKRPATRLIPHLKKLEPYGRRNALEQMVAAKPWDAATRQAVLDLAGDASEVVRELALKSLAEVQLSAAEVQRVEGYLTRKSGDLRRGVLAILLKQDDAGALASGKRLLGAKDAQQRLAGLELVRMLTDAQRCIDECRQLAGTHRAKRRSVTKEEEAHLSEIATEKSAAPTLDDALGLMDGLERTPVVPPRDRKALFITPAAVACLKSLDELIHEHRDAPIRFGRNEDAGEELLGNLRWQFPSPDYRKPRDEQERMLPLRDIWTKWHAERGKKLRDKDGLELVRALIWSEMDGGWSAAQWEGWAQTSAIRKQTASVMSGGHEPCEMKYPHLVKDVLEWVLYLDPCDARDYLLEAVETAYARLPDEELMHLGQPIKAKDRPGYYPFRDDDDWRNAKPFELWQDAILQTERITGLELTAEHNVRLWRLMHWRDEPFAGARRRRPENELLRRAYSSKTANLADIADQLLGRRGGDVYSAEGFSLLSELTARKRSKEWEAWLADHPEVRQLVDRGIERIVDLELSRGDAPTAATPAAHALGSLSGIETLRRILQVLGKGGFKLGAMWRATGAEDRRITLTSLARITYPAEGETPEDFIKVMKRAVREGQFPEEELLQLTFLAPQWIKHIEAYFGWDGMSEGVYWFLAHMRYVGGLADVAAAAGEVASPGDTGNENAEAATDSADSMDGDGDAQPRRKLSAWDRLILERTPLSEFERSEGAIDVPWFQRTYAQLGDKRWQRLAAAARFAANASQAKRAAFIADVLLNRVARKELVDGINKRQLKDNVRLLGLLPLATGKKRDADLLERCRILREYRRYANGLSGLTKPAAVRSWEIGMRNLARTAGYADPLRLEWAVGAEAVKDLVGKPLTVERDGVSISLSLDALSKPVIAIRRGEKELKSIPPAIKKDKKVAELTGRVTDLKRQAAGIRQSLETAMCRGDEFSGDELRSWCGHPLVAPLLSRLVVVGEGIVGYPDKQGKALRDHQGKLEPVKPSERLRLAHPHDLLKAEDWHDWQRECFRSERVQPFKQVFRELYVFTKQERKDGDVSHRYDGQQVQPTQALALFGSRGWNTQDGVFKVFHDVELTASVYFDSGFGTPLEVEGATIAGVSFVKRDQWKAIPLADVPPRLFSEVMRDLDLVVSVAHAGGVDPEASASTVEMRESLLRETCDLLKMKNVRFKAAHALITGKLADYSVHLGSGTVHKMPGGALCVVPVHSQHRGRLFLPFADDDPRTAEVVSKVLLLARDHEIQDPSILEQIRLTAV